MDDDAPGDTEGDAEVEDISALSLKEVAAWESGRYNMCSYRSDMKRDYRNHRGRRSQGWLLVVASFVAIAGMPRLLAVAAAPVVSQDAGVAKDDRDRGKDSGKEKGKESDKRPRLVLKAQPPVAISPARVILTAEIVGGADDFQDYYCTGVQWDWGDDTKSESTTDCAPYEAGKSEIKRRFTVEHVFRRGGVYKVYFRLMRRDKIVAAATTSIQVRQGNQEF